MSFLGRGDRIAARRDAGFALAVLGPALLTALGCVLSFGFDDADVAWRANMFLLAFLVAAVIIALAALLIGLPLTWLLEQRRMEKPWSYPLAGFIAGAALILLAPALFGEAPFQFLPYAWIGALPGGACGAIWWLVYRRRVQDAEDRDGRG